MTRCSSLILSLSVLPAIFLSVAPRSAHAVAVGPIDDFEDGSVENWTGSSTTNLLDAGPGGAGDNALEVEAFNRVVIFNQVQWTGDYLAAGIDAIAMDVRHQNSFPLELRLAIANGSFGPSGSGNTYVTNYSVNVPGDGVWRHITFNVSPADLVATDANTSVSPDPAAALAGVTHLRILHNPEPTSFMGATGGGVFQLDNIAAIPEPAAAVLALTAIAAALAARGAARRA